MLSSTIPNYFICIVLFTGQNQNDGLCPDVLEWFGRLHQKLELLAKSKTFLSAFFSSLPFSKVNVENLLPGEQYDQAQTSRLKK